MTMSNPTDKASVARIIEWLQGYADDPTWADHAEVPKTLLRAAVSALSPAQGDVNTKDCPKCGWKLNGSKFNCPFCDLITIPPKQGDGMRDVLAKIEVCLDEIEDTVRGSLATGFAHGPLTIKDYRDYEERCRWAAKNIRDALASRPDNNKCFECDTPLQMPICPKCNPEFDISNHDRQPSMTDEEIESESRDLGLEAVHPLDEMYPAAFKAVPATAKISLRNHVSGKSRAAIKRASQRQ